MEGVVEKLETKVRVLLERGLELVGNELVPSRMSWFVEK